MDFQFLGGASEVGRLGMILKKGPTSLLFDYGLLPRDPPQYPLPAPPVDGMFISHAHLDHTGMIPWVTRRQDVDVVLTPPTADVADLLLQDSLKIADAEGFDAPFDDGELRTARRGFRTIDFGDNVGVGDLEVTAHPAGHIPGATMFEVNGAETSLFTCDLHTLTTDLVWGAKPVACDTLFIESTYAGRQHPERLKSEHAFLRKIEQVVNRGGLALVPSFAVGRTQDVILTLAKARHEVWLDGMGKKVNSIYVENPEYIKSVKALRKAMHHVSVVRGPRDSEMAVQGEVIVTTSGMLDGGPVLRYLEKIREDPRSAVLLTGYQVEGTNGRRLVEEGVIDLYGVTVDIKCERQKVDVPFLFDEPEHLRIVEDIEQLLEMFVVQFDKAFVDGEVLSQFLADGLRPGPMVSVEHPSGIVTVFQSVDGRIGREVGTGERREDAAARDRLRLAGGVADDQDVVRVRALRKPERDSSRDVQDRLGAFRVLPDLRPEQHPFQVRVCVPFAHAQADPRRVSARDDPSEESRRNLVSDEEFHVPRVSSHAGHLDLEAGDDLPGPEDVEPFRDVRADPVTADEELAPERFGLPVLIQDDLDAAILSPGGLGLRPQERVGSLPDRVRRDRAVEHGPLHDDRFRLVPVDHELATRWRIEFGPVDRADDRLLAVHVLEDTWRDEAAALNRLPDLPVLLDERALVSGRSDLAREISAGGAGPDHDHVACARRRDHVPASLLQVPDDLEEVL